MNKNTIIGFVLIGLIFLGFSFYQSKQYDKQVAYQQQQDSIRLANKKIEDSIARANAPIDTVTKTVATPKQEVAIYKDANLEKASKLSGEIFTLKNDVLELEITSKGAQPYSAHLLKYKNYDKTPLYLFKGGDSELGYIIYTGETINTKNFVFDVIEHTDSSVVMRLPFSTGSYLEQKYTLTKGKYSVQAYLSFVGMDKVIPRNVGSFDTDWKLTVPRMEKGYKSEVQYSKVEYLYPGENKPDDIGGGKDANKVVENKISWFAFKAQFFSAILRSYNDFSSGDLSISYIPENNESHNLMTCEAKMRTNILFTENNTLEYQYYFGPNHYSTLKSYGQNYEKLIPLGGWLVGWFTRFVIIPLFNFLNNYIVNFGIIILLMTIFIKIVVLPFTYKSYSSAAKMQVLKPEIDKIGEKYPNKEDAVKKQQATMDLYKRAGVSPFGGCLPMLLQLPILWAMFRFFPASIELRQQNFLWADDLSSYDSIIHFNHSLPLIGDHISLFALLMAISMFFYSKITQGGQMASNDPNAKMMKFMSLWLMPIMMFFIGNSLSAGLSYYYLLSNLITMLESFIIKKYFVDKDAIYAKLKASEGKPVQKSKWQLRLEQAQKMQQEMQKQKKK